MKRRFARLIREMREGDWAALRRKARTILCLPLSVPVVLLVRALRPHVLIRFGSLWGERIGRWVNVEMYLCRREALPPGRRTVDLFYHRSTVCNQQLKIMWERALRVHPFARELDVVNRLIPGGDAHECSLPFYRDTQGFFRRMPGHFAFTPEEEQRGRAALQELGIPESAPFVGFHSRDSAYLDAAAPETPETDWRYHDYRDSSIQHYLPAAEELTRRGYFAIRMGAIVKEPLRSANPMIIDYAMKGRTDFLDIYLGATCRFFLGNTAGIYAVPDAFRRPIAYANYIPLEYAHTWGDGSLFIPKKLWLRGERRFLTFREIVESGMGRCMQAERYERLGIEPVENTPEEITALTKEMDERLNGTWQTTEEEEALQRRFWSLFKRDELNGVFYLRIGSAFLRENRALLDGIEEPSAVHSASWGEEHGSDAR